HLMLTARYMREQGVRARLGFFLHIPFPAPDMFEKLPWRQAVLRSLLEFDIIGFQTDRDRSNFASCAQRLIPEVSVGSANPHPAPPLPRTAPPNHLSAGGRSKPRGNSRLQRLAPRCGTAGQSDQRRVYSTWLGAHPLHAPQSQPR